MRKGQKSQMGRKSQAGVMLIEALIGILIFSIGILALIGMQATAIKNTTDARYRSEAAFLANQLVGKMWVDRANLALYTASGYAPRDAWVNTVASTLPGIDLPNNIRVPTVAIAAGNEVTVTIQWQQPGETTVRNVQMINYINGAI
jgi:type IV pilus assembly protein PilV